MFPLHTYIIVQLMKHTLCSVWKPYIIKDSIVTEMKNYVQIGIRLVWYFTKLSPMLIEFSIFWLAQTFKCKSISMKLFERKKYYISLYFNETIGDAIFFHCNTIHHSSANRSDLRRWAFIMTYNRASNNPTMVHHHPQYTPLEKVSTKMKCKNYH